MLQKPDNQTPLDPEQLMRGICPTCGAAVVCVRGQCQDVADGFGGKAPHAACPNAGISGISTKTCGRRVRMSPVDEY
jgi:hypothetical protein